MEQWQLSDLGGRFFSKQFSTRDMSAFFLLSTEERAFVDVHRQPFYRMAVALQLGFLRMTGCLPDRSAMIPECVWGQLTHQLGVDPLPRPDTVRSLYANRPRTLAEHQLRIRQFMGWSSMTRRCVHSVLLWLKEDLSTQPGSLTLLERLRICLYERRILIAPERTLRQWIARAAREVKIALYSSLERAFGEVALNQWTLAMAQARAAHTKPQKLWRAIVLGTSAYPLNTLLDIIEPLYLFGIQHGWPPAFHPIMVRYYGERHARRASGTGPQIDVTTRVLEAACFMRYALCRSTDQLLQQLCKWVARALSGAERDADASAPNFQKQAREFARVVKALTVDADRPSAEVCQQLHTLADAQLVRLKSTRASRVRTCLLSKGMQARVVLVRVVHLTFDASEPNPIINALHALRDVYAHQAHILPSDLLAPFKQEWRALVNSDDRRQALHAFEWATLLALRTALINQSIWVEHRFGAERIVPS